MSYKLGLMTYHLYMQPVCIFNLLFLFFNSPILFSYRCLHKSGGILQLLPGTTCQVIVACCVLHNMARRANLPDEDLLMDEEGPAEAVQFPAEANGMRVRARLIADFFD